MQNDAQLLNPLLTMRTTHNPSFLLSWPQTVFGEGGVLAGICAGKAYVDMSTVDEQTSMRIAEAVVAKGGRFLEVGNGLGVRV